MNLSLLDAVVIGVPFIVIILVAQTMRRHAGRSVADFLAANRSAGRFLISSSQAAGAASAVAAMAAMEVFSKVGFSLSFWDQCVGVAFLLLSTLGIVSYRFRQTRALTFHQFFEARYSKQVRVTASFLNVFSGLINFGVGPAIGGRFFVHFCSMPEHLTIAGMVIPTFVPVMLVLMAASLFFAFSGGQISVMITDCMESVISSFLFLVIAIFILCTIPMGDMREALLAGPPGKSYVDPFDIAGQQDFNGWYVAIGLAIGIYYWRGNAWGNVSAARSAHEGRMAQIVGNWRTYSYATMIVLISMAAFTTMHHPGYEAQRIAVEQSLAGITSEQMRTQLTMPTALGMMFPPGIRGAFCAVLLFGLLSAQSGSLFNYGTVIMQDVILPLRRTPLDPRTHIRSLRWLIIGVAAFACVFSILYKPVDYLVMIAMLMGSIYLGGVACVVWGGLYWRRATAAGAMTSMILGAGLGIAGNLVQQFWTDIAVTLMQWFPGGGMHAFLANHADRCPLNGLEMTCAIAVVCTTAFIVVSLLTCHQPHDLDKLLHRGRHHVPEEGEAVAAAAPVHKTWLDRMLGIDEDFTAGDRRLTIFTFLWVLGWKLLVYGIILYTLLVGHIPAIWWFGYHWTVNVVFGLIIAVVATCWFTWGVARDLRAAFRSLREGKRDQQDNGWIREDSSI